MESCDNIASGLRKTHELTLAPCECDRMVVCPRVSDVQLFIFTQTTPTFVWWVVPQAIQHQKGRSFRSPLALLSSCLGANDPRGCWGSEKQRRRQRSMNKEEAISNAAVHNSERPKLTREANIHTSLCRVSNEKHPKQTKRIFSWHL